MNKPKLKNKTNPNLKQTLKQVLNIDPDDDENEKMFEALRGYIDPLYTVNKYHVSITLSPNTGRPGICITYNDSHDNTPYYIDSLVYPATIQGIKDFLQLPYEDMPLHLNDKCYKEVAAFRIKMES